MANRFCRVIAGVFALLIIINTINLVYAFIRKRAGSRLTLRLVGLSVVLMLIPAPTVYWFSTWLIEKGMDSWFDADVENAMHSSLELSRWSFDSRMRSLRGQVQGMVDEISTSPDEIAALALESFIEAEDGPNEVMLLHSSRDVIASANKETVRALMTLPPEAVLREVAQKDEPYTGLDTIGESGIHMRFVFPVPR